MSGKNTTPVIVNEVTFDENGNNFNINGDSIKFLFSIDKKDFSEKGYSFIFFRKSRLSENEIFPVVTKNQKSENKTIGWIIPIAALESSEHDYGEDKHFAVFAYHATEFILKIFETDKIVVNGTFKPLNCFRDDIAICVISNGLTFSFNGFDLALYVPSFRTFGYAFIKGFIKEEDFRDYNEFFQLLCTSEKNYSFIGNAQVIESKNIRIYSLTEKFSENVFCLNFFKNTEFDNHTPLLVFLLLYQFIELHFEMYSREKIREFLHKTKEENWYSLTQFKIDINNISSENTLVSTFFQGHGSENLRIYCNDFLGICNIPEENDVGKAVYRVRNLIFHSNRNLPDEKSWHRKLCDINNELHDIIIKLITARH